MKMNWGISGISNQIRSNNFNIKNKTTNMYISRKRVNITMI